MATEEWRDIPGYEGSYEVSDMGRVRSLPRVVMRKNGVPQTVKGRILGNGIRRGRKSAMLHKGGGFKSHYIHTLVLESFVGPRPEGHHVCHWDGDENNNTLENLRWGTPKENADDKRRHGTHNNSIKTRCKLGHPLEHPNLVQSRAKNGQRVCLACHRAGSYVNYHSHLKENRSAIADSYFDQIINNNRKASA